jgi:hypothetical protein
MDINIGDYYIKIKGVYIIALFFILIIILIKSKKK